MDVITHPCPNPIAGLTNDVSERDACPWWCLIGSQNWVNIGTDNGLTPIWHQVITRANTDFFSVRTLGMN